MSTNKRVTASIAVHPIQADIIVALQEGKIDFTKHSLRDIAEIIKLDGETSPQKIKHHLQQLVSLGALQIINAEYHFYKL